MLTELAALVQASQCSPLLLLLARSSPCLLLLASSSPSLLLLASCSLVTASALCLQEQSLVDIEMPGQHVSGDEPVPDSTVYVERISSSVVVVRRHSSSFRRLGFIGSDGRTRFFIVQVGNCSLTLALLGLSHAAAWTSACLLLLCMAWAALTQHRTCWPARLMRCASDGQHCTALHSVSCTAPCSSNSPTTVSICLVHEGSNSTYAHMRRG